MALGIATYGLLLLAYSALSGIVEGILYGKKGADSFKGNEHGFFFAKMVAVGCLVLVKVDVSQWDRNVLVAAWIFMHAFVHDGFYYETRRQIDVPYYRWYYDYSKTSTARLEIPFWPRTILFAIGSIGLAIYMIWAK